MGDTTVGYEIPTSEFRERIEALQLSMQKKGYDLIVAYGNETEPQFVRYLSNYWPSFETAGVLVPAEGEAMLLIGPESLAFAADRSKLEQIRQLKAFRESSEPEYPGKALHTFKEVIQEALQGRRLRKLGIAGLSLMTVDVYNDLAKSVQIFGDVHMEKADVLLTDLRMIKSDNELACMREAARITRLTFDYVLERIRPGMTESQVVGLALSRMHELGAERESYPMWVLTGAGSNQAIGRARHKVITKGDLTHIQIGARVAGYASSIGRAVVFGKATEQQRSLIEAGYAGQRSVIEAMRGGAAASDIAKHYEAVMTDAGYGDWLLYGPCHGNGLMEGEPPWVETTSDWKFNKNMTFCVDIYLGNKAQQIGLRIEDVVRVDNDCAENLTNYPQKVFEL